MPEGARTCPFCGRPRGGPAWIGCVARPLAWAVALVGLRILFAGGALRKAGGSLFAFVFGRTFEAAAGSALSVAATVGTFALLLDAATGGRSAAFASYWKALGRLARAAARGSEWLARLLLLLVEGVPMPAKRKSRKEEGDGPR